MYKLINVRILCWFPLILQLFAGGTLSIDKPYCEVREPKFNNFYNFTKLTKSTDDILIQKGLSNSTLRIQLCSSLVKKCNGKDNYAICLTKNDKEIGIGKIPPDVINKSGIMIFQFTGDNCKSNVNYIVNVSMECDYKVTGNSVPVITSIQDECYFRITWKTQYACAQRTQTNCSILYQGQYYDLSPLTKSSNNYVVYIGNSTSSSIILNVCHSVIFKNGALCHPSSGVCLQSPANSSNYVSVGEVQDPPKFENGQLKIVYPNGYMCKLPKLPNVQDIKTTITFTCDYESTNSLPQYVGGRDECHYQLLWKTPAACSVESLKNHSASTAGTCTVTDPVANFTYNLQPLMKKEFTVTTKNSVQYKFAVCGQQSDNKCKSGTGACLVTSGISMGMASSKLMWQNSGPYLSYTDGDVCHNGSKRNTIITFQCGAEGSVSEPEVVEDDPCNLVIRWNTYLVCEKNIKCATENGEINLAPLILWDSNYVVKTGNAVFHINVCRPLVRTPSLTCSDESAACKTVSSDNQNSETSLGIPEESPRLSKDHVVLHYTGGSSCSEKPGTTISSVFKFICDYNKEGLPELKEYVNCTYFFEWRTSIACGAVMGDWSPPCLVKDQFLSHQYNLSMLYPIQSIYSVKGKQGQYAVGICGGDKRCYGSAVCQGGNNYGSLANVILDYTRRVIRLKYTNGSKCVHNSSSYTSEVRLMCNESVGVGQPRLIWEWDCSANFEWQTSVTCTRQVKPNQSTSRPDDGDNGQQYSPSHSGTVVGIVLTIILLLAALIYFSNPSKRKEQMRACINWFTSKRTGGRVKYCRVDTTEEARLLLDASDPTQCQSDSDEDLLGA